MVTYPTAEKEVQTFVEKGGTGSEKKLSISGEKGPPPPIEINCGLSKKQTKRKNILNIHQGMRYD